MTNRLRILILEDEPIIALDLRDHCEELGYEVVASCYSLPEALRQVEANHPNFALVDIRIGQRDDGILLGKKLTEEYGIPFIYITSFFDDQTIEDARKTLPAGYLVKPITKGGLDAAIKVGVSNFLKWNQGAVLLDEKIQSKASTPLTARELEMVMDLLKGKTNQEIADSRFISLNTVKTHLKNIYLKLNVESRAQLLVLLS